MADAGFLTTNRIFEEEVAGKGDFAALARVYTPGARLMPPGAPTITGLPGIIAYWQATAAALGVTGLKLHTVELTVTGDTAAELGRAEVFTAPGAAPAAVKYVVLWKRVDGAWRWDVDCFNFDA